ncbi:MAG: MCE family protein [Gammaproteobacteria bacterium]|jgi:phospholipid/cholesterol/gamma-HCH transport system substrate-binding protein|nr:MCE family protein [Gammaproteobacteria bacterium]MBU1601705.1 MCE family protein [Gammaproteobacteria bacterium]MBU2434784.1 MCE family protein [Gammaproteobacteria bacterium]MBU2448025.1 MCE family protein [Gammaproteobacteria bacterium]PKO38429.1 MAG: MCE family protein [Betaproteobacteria bacterium HGW-Betaproteobacteria-4]
MENKSYAFAAGLFALLLGVAALLAIYWLNGSKDSEHDYIVVTKQNIGGLNPQAQVRYRGIRVGKVSDIRLDPEDYSNILVTISVNDDVPLTKGTVAKLNYQGVTGLAHILLLETGKDNEALVPNNEQPPRIAMIPSMLEELTETGMATLAEARQMMASANAMLDAESRAHLKATLANLETVSGNMKPVLDNLNMTLSQVNKLLDDRNIRNLAQAAGEVQPLLADTRILIGKMQVATDKLDIAIGDASAGGTSALMPRLNELATDFSLTSRQLSRVLRVLEDTPQGLVFGAPAPAPGPGEPGFNPDAEK